MGHLRAHAEKLGLPIEEDTDREIRIMGSKAVALSTNWRTAQGYTGDVWFDEFAWAPRPDALFNAVVPAITRVGGRITVCSTPWVPGNLFWKIATDHQGRYGHYSRHTITIHDALKDGMPLPGGLDELRLNFDAASWAMFFECQWAEEEGALLPWALLDAIAEDIELVGKKAAAPRYGRLRLGVDLGRGGAAALVLVGELLDPVSLAPTGRVRVLKTHSVQGMDFASQRSLIEDWIARYDPEHVAIDRSGLGCHSGGCLHRRPCLRPRMRGRRGCRGRGSHWDLLGRFRRVGVCASFRRRVHGLGYQRIERRRRGAVGAGDGEQADPLVVDADVRRGERL
ncbi:MAG: terminase large subunit domain-containing protein [Thiobacillaceae bacterium]